MSGSTDLAVRKTGVQVEKRDGAQEYATDAALAIRPGQSQFDAQQRASLVTLGIPADAPQADLDVFLHVSQRMGLDPFAKQIYLIYRLANEGFFRNGSWVDNYVKKPSIQTGIDGFRVTRERAAKREDVKVDYEPTTWYDKEGNGYDVWLWDYPPTACRVVVKISDGRRYPSTLRFNEYAQRSKKKELTGRWAEGHSHQIEKCCEADGLRKAFPQDYSGVVLEDMAPLQDEDAQEPQPERPRVTAAQAKASAPQRVTATVETVTPSPSPAAPESPRSAPSATPADTAAAGEADNGPAPDDPAYRRAMNAAQAQLKRFTAGDTEEELSESKRVLAARILRVESVTSMSNLTVAELRDISNTCGSATGPDSAAQLEALLTKGEVPGGE
jgi:hypothetical protein